MNFEILTNDKSVGVQNGRIIDTGHRLLFVVAAHIECLCILRPDVVNGDFIFLPTSKTRRFHSWLRSQFVRVYGIVAAHVHVNAAYGCQRTSAGQSGAENFDERPVLEEEQRQPIVYIYGF